MKSSDHEEILVDRFLVQGWIGFHRKLLSTTPKSKVTISKFLFLQKLQTIQLNEAADFRAQKDLFASEITI